MNLPVLDTSLFFFINRDLQNSFFDLLMPLITKRAYLFFFPLFLLFFLKDRKKAILALILGFASLLLADWASNTLKYFFERTRPCSGLDGVRVLVGCGKSFSMPSNHAVNAFAFMVPFYLLIKNRMKYAFAIIAFLVAFSRVYVGVHYPSDIAAGSVLGIFFAISVMQVHGWAYKRYKYKPHSTVLIIFLLAVGLFRVYYILNGPLDLSPDEAHYWEWSRRLDLSYYSKGPMIAYLISLGTFIFGNTVFGIRIMAVIFSSLSSMFIYRLGKQLYSEQVGLFSAILIQAIPLFSAYGIVFTIDSPFIFFWIMALVYFNKALGQPSATDGQNSGDISKEDMKPNLSNPMSQLYWCLLGLSIGFGLLTKYTMAFFNPCAFLFLCFSKDLRRLLLTKGPYIAVIVSILVFSPVIIWNANHDWVTLRHTAGQAHIAEGISVSLKSFVEFLGSQLGVITPLLLFLMAFSIWNLRRERSGAYLFWFSVPVFVFFFFKSIQAKVQANWALPCYITGIVAFSAFYLKRFSQDGTRKKVLVAAALALSLIVTSVAHYSSMLNLPAKMDPALRLSGWEDLGETVSGLYQQMSLVHPVFIFSDKYQVSSELAFYVKGRPATYCINLGRRMNQYDLWPGFENLSHYNAIFVMVDDTPVPERVSDAFGKVEKKVFTTYTKKHTKIREYSIFLCYDFRGIKEQRPETF
jgi:4-amino-4-deoxy-L-arabinose transferase-like glycosyltransferase/membrane-associated phospholipid phosphatase